MSETSLKEKQAVIDEIKDKIVRASSTVVIDYMGITVAEADAMRKKLRDADVDYKVYKNTLVNRAVDGTEFSPLSQVLEGPSAFAFSYEDATAPARVLAGVMKDYKKMSFKAGIIEGTFYDADGMKAVSEVPTRDELLARLFGSFKSPISSFARVLNAIAEAGGGDAASAEAPAAAAEEATVEEAPTEEAVTAEEAAPAEEAVTAEEAPAVTEEAESAIAEEAAPAEEQTEE